MINNPNVRTMSGPKMSLSTGFKKRLISAKTAAARKRSFNPPVKTNPLINCAATYSASVLERN
jgi:hypothetical protein